MKRVSLRLDHSTIARLTMIARRKGVNFGQLARLVLNDVQDPELNPRHRNRETSIA